MKSGCLGKIIGSFDINQKTWQIDHIIPQSKLIYESLDDENFQKCWALENLKPLDTLENLKKGNKIFELKLKTQDDEDLWIKKEMI